MVLVVGLYPQRGEILVLRREGWVGRDEKIFFEGL